MAAIRLRFWGVRGSVPCPGPKTVKCGGNTACLELRFGEAGRLVVIDAGTGIRELAAHVMKTDLPKGPIKTQLFLTHTHWDHIMGFPFFIPIFIPTTELDVYGPVTYEEDTLDKIVGGHALLPLLAGAAGRAGLQDQVHQPQRGHQGSGRRAVASPPST